MLRKSGYPCVVLILWGLAIKTYLMDEVLTGHTWNSEGWLLLRLSKLGVYAHVPFSSPILIHLWAVWVRATALMGSCAGKVPVQSECRVAISHACIKPPLHWVLLYKVCKVRMYVWLYYFPLGWFGLVAKLCLTLATPWTVAYQASVSMGIL